MPPKVMTWHFWLRFSELCKYKVKNGTMRVIRSKESTDNIITNWIHFIRKRYAHNLLLDKYKSSLNEIQFEGKAGQITKKGYDGWFAKLQEFQNENGTEKKSELVSWGNC
jgi:hypothetical protein